jgi:CDP-diacylglycerol---glycerol-3-phosphate 3-phosphatidyltransferase
MVMAAPHPSPERDNRDLLWTTPNLLSLFRIALVPVLVYLLYDPGPTAGAVAAVLFVAGSLSDYYDGYLARKHGIVTTLGKFLDPLADKLLVVSVLIMLVAMPCLPGADAPCEPRVPPWLAVLIVARELAVTGLRSIASSEGITLAAEELGKYKTIFQIFAVTGLLMHYRYALIDFHLAGVYFLWIAVVLGLWSGVDYHVRVYRAVRARGRSAPGSNIDSLP